MDSPLEGRIGELVGPTVEDLGFTVVRIQTSGQRRVVLQIMIEHPDGQPPTVDDCARVSRAVSAILDVEDPIRDAYTLEVSSPGIDRPLTRPGDFERFVGQEAKVELVRPLDGRRRFRGRLLGLTGDGLRMLAEGAEVVLPLADIQRAKLVLTDELLAMHREKQETEGQNDHGN
ncbi:MAG: ribosome maturation factor RimP [Magnetospirillum sp. WYHS-4]